MLFNRSFHRCVRVLAVVGLFAISMLSVQPAFAEELTPQSTTESFVLSELQATGYVDLQNFPEAERVISGQFLRTALENPDVLGHSRIMLENVIVVGVFWGSDLVIPANLDMRNIDFRGDVFFDGAQLQSLVLIDSSIQGHLSIQRAALNGNVDLRNNVIDQGLNLYGSNFAGELLLDQTQILGTEPMSGGYEPVEIWAVNVAGPASFIGSVFQGAVYFGESSFKILDLQEASFHADVSFTSVRIAESADLNHAVFQGAADFTDFYVGNSANLTGATFEQNADFTNATVIRSADFTDAVFQGEAIFDYFTADRFMDFVNTTFQKDVSFYYASVTWPYFENAVFKGPVTFEGMQTSQDFELSNSVYSYMEEPFLVSSAKVDGAVKFTDFTAPAGLQLSESQYGSLQVSTKDNPDIAFIDLTSTNVADDVLIENVHTQEFLAESFSAGGATTLNSVQITKSLDMRNASIGFLKIENDLEWPHNPKAFNLRGMNYTDIDLGDKGLTEETWQGLLLLINESAYSPQAYQALSEFLTAKGHPDWAAEVDLARNRRERDEILPRFSGAWFWSWFLDIFDGYGHRPALAFIWSGLVVLVGALVFRRREDMCPVDQDDLQLNYNPIWYSFSLFLPYIDLGIASKWEPSPERMWARNYKYVHMMLGWILAPIALLTFGGIIG